MELKVLTFTQSDEGEAQPETITVQMTVQEALWIARVSGQQRGSSPHNGIYDCLVGDIFDRFWEEGVDGAIRQFHFEIPPIRYVEE